ELLPHVYPGLAVETARARLEELGFRCRYAGVFARKPQAYHPTRSLPEVIGGRDAGKDKLFHTLVCSNPRDEIGNWGRRYFPVTVNLPYDENGIVTEVEVPPVLPQVSRYAAFFARRPDLREPVGLPVEQARALMQAQKFRCAYAASGGNGQGGRPFLDCHAYDETPLGGNIIRVHLFYDATQTVTDAKVVQERGGFDDLRCMLPNPTDSLGQGVFK